MLSKHRRAGLLLAAMLATVVIVAPSSQGSAGPATVPDVTAAVIRTGDLVGSVIEGGSPVVGSTGVGIALLYTAATDRSGVIKIKTPAWPTAPQTTDPTKVGYVRAGAANLRCFSADATGVQPSGTSWIISVSFSCADQGAFLVYYGAGTGVTIPTKSGAYPFVTQMKAAEGLEWKTLKAPPTVNVQPGPTVGLTLSAGGFVIAEGQPAPKGTIRVSAVDQYGNVTPGVNGTANLTYVTPRITIVDGDLPPSVTITNGVGSVTWVPPVSVQPPSRDFRPTDVTVTLGGFSTTASNIVRIVPPQQTIDMSGCGGSPGVAVTINATPVVVCSMKVTSVTTPTSGPGAFAISGTLYLNNGGTATGTTTIATPILVDNKIVVEPDWAKGILGSFMKFVPAYTVSDFNTVTVKAPAAYANPFANYKLSQAAVMTGVWSIYAPCTFPQVC